MDGGSKQLPSNGLGYMSTVKFAYNGKEFEFSTTEPESTKKKAEHKAADLCINAVEAKYKEKLRPDEQNKSTLAQVCKYGITNMEHQAKSGILRGLSFAFPASSAVRNVGCRS